MAEDATPWPIRVRLHEVQRSGPTLIVEAAAAQRAAIAGALDLLALKRFAARVRLIPWLDGAELDADWEADITQTCGVTLDAFDTTLSGAFRVRVAPASSPAAATETSEVSIDPEAEDPPDMLDGDAIEVGGYLVEHLALEIDPYPRRPGASFEPPPPEGPVSPFTVLQALKSSPERKG